MDWETCILEELTEPDRPVTYGVVKPGDHDDQNGVLFVRGGDIFDGKIDIASLRTITQEVSQQYKRTLLRGGEILVSLVGNPGAVATVPHELAGANIARQAGLVALSDKADGKYVEYFLRSPAGQAAMGLYITGAVQKVINLGDLKRVQIPLPPLPIQRRIAGILSAYDDLIEVNTRRIKALEEMARRTYEEWFGSRAIASVDSASTDSNTEWWALEEIASEVRDSVDPGSVDAATRYLGLEHLPRRSLTLTEWGDPASTVSTKLEFVPGDVLFGKIRPYFHKVGYAAFSGITSSDTIVIRPHEAEFRALVTMAAFSDAFVEHAVQTSNGTKMPRASWAVLKRYGVPKVDAGTLARFSNGVLPQLDLAASLATQNTNLRAQRDLLLPRLVSGAIDVSEAEAPLPERVEVAAE